MVIEAQTNGDNDLADKLKRHFRFSKDLILRAEHIFYYELVKLVPALTSLRRVLDGTVLSKLVGKAKCMEDPRPDYFHFDMKTNIALHGEFDERNDHEESMERLRTIAHHAGCGDRVYYFRVKGRLDTPEALCKRVTRQGMVLYQMTADGKRVVSEVASYVRACIDKMGAGIPPSTFSVPHF